MIRHQRFVFHASKGKIERDLYNRFMDKTTAHILCDINTEFYRKNAVSFSATRGAPWQGWQECARYFERYFAKRFKNCSSAYTGKQRRKHTGKQANVIPQGQPNKTPGGQIDELLKTPQRASVFDLACGNLRFEAFLAERFSHIDFSFFAVDNCDELLPEKSFGMSRSNNSANIPSSGTVNSLHFQNLDVISCLLDGNEHFASYFDAEPCDFSVSFGFMHHVPTQLLRGNVMQALIDQTQSGGLIAVSFWQFMNNEGLAKKAQRTHQEALELFHASNIDENKAYSGADSKNQLRFDVSQLEEGDFFLGWKDTPGQYRYCHNFTEHEINELVSLVGNEAKVVSRFIADGRTNNLNSYLILQKR